MLHNRQMPYQPPFLQAVTQGTNARLCGLPFRDDGVLHLSIQRRGRGLARLPHDGAREHANTQPTRPRVATRRARQRRSRIDYRVGNAPQRGRWMRAAAADCAHAAHAQSAGCRRRCPVAHAPLRALSNRPAPRPAPRRWRRCPPAAPLSRGRPRAPPRSACDGYDAVPLSPAHRKLRPHDAAPNAFFPDALACGLSRHATHRRLRGMELGWREHMVVEQALELLQLRRPAQRRLS